jgi:predicted dienelactone hydrolase
MAYDPITRGAAPVGVRTIVLRDEARGGRTLEVELWYPAAGSYRGQDLDPATQDRFEAAPGQPSPPQRAVRDAGPRRGSFPLLLFFHGAYAHRRYSTELCTHLASHGYLVAAPDFPGNTLADQLHDNQLGAGVTPRLVSLHQSAMDRPLDAQLVLDRLLDGAAPGFSELIDREKIGTLGQSFGGWTCLVFNSRDARPKATFPIVPPWGRGPAPTEVLSDLVCLDDWGRNVPTLVLAAERDSLIMLDSVHDLYRKLKGPKRLAVLRGAGHVHFADDAEAQHEEFRAACAANAYLVMPDEGQTFDFPAIAATTPPFSALCPAEHGQTVVRGLSTAHMDMHLKQLPAARTYLNGDLAALFAARGIDLEVQ